MMFYHSALCKDLWMWYEEDIGEDLVDMGKLVRRLNQVRNNESVDYNRGSGGGGM